MKATGIVRRIDELGRIVIPKEIRKQLMMKEGECISFSLDGDYVLLKKFSLLHHISPVIDSLLDGLEYKYHNLFLVSDLTHILMCSSSALSQYQNKELNDELKLYIQQEKTIYEHLFEFSKYQITMFPLYLENECIGSFMMLTNKTPYYMIDKTLLEFSKEIIEQEINSCV